MFGPAGAEGSAKFDSRCVAVDVEQQHQKPGITPVESSAPVIRVPQLVEVDGEWHALDRRRELEYTTTDPSSSAWVALYMVHHGLLSVLQSDGQVTSCSRAIGSDRPYPLTVRPRIPHFDLEVVLRW